MKIGILEIGDKSFMKEAQVNSEVTFKKLIEKLRNKVRESEPESVEQLQAVLHKLTVDERFLGTINLEEIQLFSSQLKNAYNLLIPAITEESNVLMAFSSPIKPLVFYGTDAFYDLIYDKNISSLKCEVAEKAVTNPKDKLQMIYAIILEKLYGFPALVNKSPTVLINSENVELPKYYRVEIDNSYVDVSAVGELPTFNIQTILSNWGADFDPMEILEVLPLSKFKFEGFSVVTLRDVTDEFALESMKNTFIDRANYDEQTYHELIGNAAKIFFGRSDLEFGLLPQLRINGKLIFNQEVVGANKVFSNLMASGLSQKEILQIVNGYFEKPEFIYLQKVVCEENTSTLQSILCASNIQAIAMLPIYHNGVILGVVNIYSEREGVIDEQVLTKMDRLVPLVEQILLSDITDFNDRIENVIQEKFTPLQPAVRWKFQEAAWDYIDNCNSVSAKSKFDKIEFKDVYPIYGAIDIKGSTNERNRALIADLKLQFGALKKVLLQINRYSEGDLPYGMLDVVSAFLDNFNQGSSDSDEIQTFEFLTKVVHPYLTAFCEDVQEFPGDKNASGLNIDEIKDEIRYYLTLADEEKGLAYTQRRALESSMSKINSVASSHLNAFRQEVEKVFPVYFEKFKTDGLEYDLYIGQSIEPKVPFDSNYLEKIRYTQLSSMAQMATAIHHLLPDLETKLVTTQLIFIHSGTIDIAFRDDERRFDVEGSYNIRYQVIKKRIDKVHLLHSAERLTQPGKIALVYFNESIVEEYVHYIHALQAQSVLQDDLEFLELEELQGVNGLKALRVSINFDRVEA